MPNPAPTTVWGRAVRCTVIGELFGQTTINNFYYGNTTAGSAPNITNFHSQFQTNVLLNFVSLLSQDFSVVGVTYTVISHPLVAPGFRSATANNVGLIAQDSLPPQMAVCIAWYTSLAGRRGRGRTFFPGVASTHHSDGVLTGAAKTSWTTVALSMDDDSWAVDGVTFSHFLFSPTSSDLELGTIRGELVVSGTVRDELCSIRRRKIGRGV